eukprot:gene10204-11886_t
MPTVLVALGFGQDRMLRLGGKLTSQGAKPNVPIESRFWASGFSFSHSTIITEVPYDPHLSHLFFGEEMVMATRLWTSGYDFYSPPVMPIFHLWSREHRASFRETKDEERVNQETHSQRRVHHILQPSMVVTTDEAFTDIDIDKYNVGTSRTLQDYQTYCGVDFTKQTISQSAKNGGYQLDYFINPIVEMAIKSQQGVPL